MPTRVFSITRDLNRGLSATRFMFRECPACCLIWLANPPVELAPHYAGRYETPPADDAAYLAHAAEEAPRIALLRAYAPGPQLLEVGGDVGLFAHAALRAGFKVQGIEMDEAAAAHMRARLGVAIATMADVESALPATPAFDAIALWQVIEHLPAPWRFIAAASRALVSGGVLVFSTPDPECTLARLFGSRWLGLDAPRHLCLLRACFVRRLAAAHGLEMVHYATDDAEARRLFVYGLGDSLANLARIRIVGGALYRLGAGLARGLLAAGLAPARLDSHTFVLRRAG